MPRKTKEQKELEEKNLKKKTAKTKKVATTKKSSTVKKTSTIKKSTTAKKASTTKRATTKKSTSTKAKSAVAKKKTTATSKKKSTTAKKSTTTKKKTSTKLKVDDLLDKTLEVAEYYDLPYRYNQTVVKILAQTPSSLFIYWEISDDDVANYKNKYGDNFFETTKPVLIVHNKTLNYSFEVDINDFANSWYLKVNNSKCEYEIELGRRPIKYNEKFDTDYIYVATSNEIEAPNDHVLLENFPNILRFRNVKTNEEYTKNISDFSIRGMKKIYNIYDLYKLIYQDENIDDIYDLSNPSSGNPSSATFSSTFK